MIMKSLVKSAAALLLGGVMIAGTANAAEFEMRQASDLDDLLKLVKERALFESAVNKDREREFIQKKAQQQSGKWPSSTNPSTRSPSWSVRSLRSCCGCWTASSSL